MSFEPVVQRHELAVAAERVAHDQRQKKRVREREYPGPEPERRFGLNPDRDMMGKAKHSFDYVFPDRE